MTLTTAQRDRACGVLLGTAAGDALGAPYEFHPARGPGQEVAMVGGGDFNWEPGEWTDDTSMAIAIAQVVATGGPCATSRRRISWSSVGTTGPGPPRTSAYRPAMCSVP